MSTNKDSLEGPKAYKEYIASNIDDYLAYQRAAGENEPEMTKMLRALLRERLDSRAPLSVLDVGCGNGNTLVHIGKEFPHWSYLGVDVVPELIEQGRQMFGALPNFRLEVCDAHEVAHRFDSAFDIVIIWRALLSFEDWQAALAAAHKLTRKGGSLIVSTLVNNVEVDLDIISTAHDSLGEGNTLPVKVLSPSVIRKAFEDLGTSHYRADKFHIGADLPKQVGTNRTYTVRMADGSRRQFAYGLLIDHWHIIYAVI